MLAPSLPLLLTELVAAPSPSLPHHTHYTIALAFVTPTRPPNYLPAYPDDARRTARTRVASAPLRSARRKSTVAPECVERWERAVRRHSFGYANSHTGIELSYLPASPGNVRRSPHVSLLATLSLSSTTSNGSWVGALAARSHTTLHTIASAVLTPTRPPSYLPESPGDDSAPTALSPSPYLSQRLTQPHI